MRHFLLSLLIPLPLFFTPECGPPRRTEPTTAIVPEKNEARFARRHDDQEINATIRMAWNHYAGDRYEQSLLDFERLITKGYDHYDVLFGAGISSLKRSDYKKAAGYFTRCLRSNASHFEALFFRAETYRLMKNPALARNDLENILNLETASPIICGLYAGEYADNDVLARRKVEAKNILGSL